VPADWPNNANFQTLEGCNAAMRLAAGGWRLAAGKLL
jgi:hypothetical protein